MKDAILFGMTFQNFSDLMSIAVLGLLFINIIFLILYGFKQSFIVKAVNSLSYQNLILSVVFVTLGGVVGANIYEHVYGDLPCILCWYQRILTYPILIIAITEILSKTGKAYKFITIFAMFNLFISSFHYYYHFMRYVMGDVLSLPCSANSLLPKCTEAGVISFGFVTMPLMSVIVSIFVLTVVWLAGKKVEQN